jgi:site-specific DNA recombinase
MRAVSYSRVSTDEQAREGHSLGAQNDRNISFINSQGWDYVDSYVDDGESAKDLNRPEIQRLLRDAEKKKFDVVVVYRLDRIVRSVTDLHFILKHFDKHGIMFKSVTEIYDTTTAMGRFFITLVAAIAQWERENLAERVWFGMEKNFREGNSNGGVAPYGYKSVNGKREFQEGEEFEVTTRIFRELRTRGGTSIAKDLNAEGKLMRGSLWTDYYIQYMLYNPIYSGRRRWNYRKLNGKKTGKEMVSESDYPAYISVEEQEELIRIRQARFKGREKTTTDYPFTGLLKCARCGKTMNATEKKNAKSTLRFYRCYGRFKLGICDMPTIAEDTIEKLLLEKLELLTEKNWLKDIIITSTSPDDDEEYEKLHKEYEEIQRRKKKWQMAYANDVISLEDLRARMQEETQKEELLRPKLEAASASRSAVSTLTADDVMRFAKDLKSNWAYLDHEHKKVAVHALFSEIVIDAVGAAIGGPGRRTPCEIKSIKTR